eukprot:62072-Rhodomonas_salina.1
MRSSHRAGDGRLNEKRGQEERRSMSALRDSGGEGRARERLKGDRERKKGSLDIQVDAFGAERKRAGRGRKQYHRT